MINIYNWTRIDNLPLGLHNEFDYIRDDAETLGDIEEWEVCNYVEEIFEKTYPQFFKEDRFAELIWVEYYPFEKELDMGENDFAGYAVYIHMHKKLVVKLCNHILDNHPEYVKNFYMD